MKNDRNGVRFEKKMSAELLPKWSVNLSREEHKGLIRFLTDSRHYLRPSTSQLLIGQTSLLGLLTASFAVEMTTITLRFGTITRTHFVLGSGLINPFMEIIRVQFDVNELLKVIRSLREVRLALNQAETHLIIGDNANSRALFLVPVTVDRK